MTRWTDSVNSFHFLREHHASRLQSPSFGPALLYLSASSPVFRSAFSPRLGRGRGGGWGGLVAVSVSASALQRRMDSFAKLDEVGCLDEGWKCLEVVFSGVLVFVFNVFDVTNNTFCRLSTWPKNHSGKPSLVLDLVFFYVSLLGTKISELDPHARSQLAA